MKKYSYPLTGLLLLCLLTLSCKKNGVHELSTTPAGTGARIKFFNFAIAAPAVNFYANEQKIAAVVSSNGTESAAGVAYGSVFPAINYSLLPAGSYTFKSMIPEKAAALPGTVLTQREQRLEEGHAYSFYTCGPYQTGGNTTDSFILEDVLPAVADSLVQVRFVNTIANAATALDLFLQPAAGGQTFQVASGIAYKSGSAFISLPAGNYAVFSRYPGSADNLISRSGSAGVSLVSGQAYTIGARGDMTVSGAAAVSRPYMDLTSNRP